VNLNLLALLDTTALHFLIAVNSTAHRANLV
jgi:hypothetical protein